MSNYTRREFLNHSVWAGVGMGGAHLYARQADSAAGAGASSKPNVLLIMTDTQRLDDMGAFGNSAIKTPHLDKLADTGVKFTQCYTQYPACMPARATIFTGRYPKAHGVWSNGVPLPKSEVTLAHVFAENGYRTGGAGKFHFLPHYPYRSPLPTMETHPEPFYGFQEYHLGEDGRSGEQWQWIKKNHPEYHLKPDHEIPVELHNSHWSASHTIEFIKGCHAKRQPFFAFCSFVDPHQGYNPPSPYREMYREEDMPEPIRREGELDKSRFKSTAESPRFKNHTKRTAYNRTQHYGEMTLIDDNVGRIVAALEELGLRENTLICFVSDHGDMLGDHYLWWKGAFHYAGCANVPLFYCWPGRIEAGKTVEGMTEQTDIMPTILDLAGMAIPDRVQGISIKPVLTGESDDTGREFAYIESISSGHSSPEYRKKRNVPRNSNKISLDTLTVRSRKYRFTYYTGTEDGELYDLEKDPNEFENRWGDPDYREIRERLMFTLMDRANASRDPMPYRTKPY